MFTRLSDPEQFLMITKIHKNTSKNYNSIINSVCSYYISFSHKKNEMQYVYL